MESGSFLPAVRVSSPLCEERLATVVFHRPQGADRCYFQTPHLWLIHKVEPTSYFQLLKYLPRRTDHSRLRSTVSPSPAQPVHAHTLPLNTASPLAATLLTSALPAWVNPCLSPGKAVLPPQLCWGPAAASVGLLHALPPGSSLEHLAVSGLPYPPV